MIRRATKREKPTLQKKRLSKTVRSPANLNNQATRFSRTGNAQHMRSCLWLSG
jgi:hypothetical protein